MPRWYCFLAALCLMPGCSIYRDPHEALWSHHRIIKEDEISQRIPVEHLREDVHFLVATIEDVHVNPYMMIGRDEFHGELERTKKAIDRPLTRKEFYQRVTPLVHKLKDSHTTVWFPKEMSAHYEESGGAFLPVDVEITEDKRLFAAHTYGSKRVDSGSEIHAINGVSSAQLIDRLLEFEKGATDLPRLRRLQPKFGRMLWEVYDFEGPFELQLKNTTVLLEGVTIDEMGRQGEAPHQDSQVQRVHYENARPRVGLLTLRSFMIRRDEFGRLLEDVFARVREDRVADLIIDVRDNQGGSEENVNELISYIWDKPFSMYSKFMRKKSEQWVRYFRQDFKWWIRWAVSFKTLGIVSEEAKAWFGNYARTPVGEVDVIDLPMTQPTDNPLRFRGSLYVLMNEHSYSATVGFLGAVKDYEMGLLIGTETGESPNGFGEAYQFDLPHSRLFARSSTTLCIRPNGDPDITKGVVPDHTVRKRSQDAAAGVDTVLMYALQMIEEGRASEMPDDGHT